MTTGAAPALALLLAGTVARATFQAALGASSAPAASHLGRRVVLVIDESRSMRSIAPTLALRDATSALLDRLAPDDQVGLVGFDRDARLLRPLRPLGDPSTKADLLAAVAGVRWEGLATDIPAGLERALYEIGEPSGLGGRDAVVVVTDGRIDTGSPPRDAERSAWLRTSLLPDARRRGIVVMALGVGPDADYQLMQEMQAATGGRYARADSAAEVAAFLLAVPADLARVDAERSAAAQAESARAAQAARPPAAVDAPAPTGAGGAHEPERRVPAWLVPAAVAALLLASGIVALMLMRGRRPSRAAGVATEPPPAGTSLRSVTSGEEIPLTRAVSLVGRDPDNDVVIPVMTVTRQHAKIRHREGSFYLEDLRSTNGTFLNGKRVEAETVLHDGDEIRFDKHRYVFQLPFDGEKTSLLGVGDQTVIRSMGELDPGTSQRPAWAGWKAPPPVLLIPDDDDEPDTEGADAEAPDDDGPDTEGARGR